MSCMGNNFMDLNFLAILMVFLPLVTACIVGLSSSCINDRSAQIITCGGALLACVIAWVLFYYVTFQNNTIHQKLFSWFDSGDFKADWAIYIDVLSSALLIVITTVSAIVHLYSIGYMSDDNHQPRFMAYLSLFTFSMIALVTADNFIQLFFGWESVGLSSYLLIGFWFNKRSAAIAAIKAFLVNRVGDIGLALGIFITFIKFNSFEYSIIFSQVPKLVNDTVVFLGFEVTSITLICLLLLIGSMGKSAQIGLHTWLPDAMEGPTPASALIHAATMVTAGVFLIARCSPIFEYSKTALIIVTIIGAVTCIFAASIAIVQNDIKRVIAYSTCSQLGYMFFACGVSAYSAAIFHLITHAFFKALLFLGAGSVIHAMSGEQQLQKMGGIWRKIPITYLLMLIGSLAIAGIPPFAGFYSKDIILEAAYMSGKTSGLIAYWLGIIAAVLTAFYSWRLLILAFHGKSRATPDVMKRIHESPFIMIFPLIILAFGAVFSGIVAENFFGIVDGSGRFWRGSILVLSKNNVLENLHDMPNFIKQVPSIAAILGIGAAYIFYMLKPNFPKKLSNKFLIIHNILINKWYFDWLYNLVFVNTVKFLGKIFYRRIDVQLIDAIPNLIVRAVNLSSQTVSALQTGYIYHYAMAMLIGVIIFIYWYLPW